MPINKILFAFLFMLGSINATLSQKSMEQKLELLFAQGHYKMVYRKAGRLLMNPSYDQETYPTKLRQLAAQELAKDPLWAKRHALELECKKLSAIWVCPIKKRVWILRASTAAASLAMYLRQMESVCLVGQQINTRIVKKLNLKRPLPAI
ncbi:MAG: hypothetical protein RJB25_516 [Bacteroidota bacterium]